MSANVVGSVVKPLSRIHIYMPHQHAVSRQVTVPSLLLSVFQHIVFAWFSRHRYAVCKVRLCQLWQMAYAVYASLQFCQCQPSQLRAFKGTIQWWSVSIVVVWSQRHGVPITRVKGKAAVIRVVVVYQSQHMTELMHECANARWRQVVILVMPQLVAASIYTKFLAIEYQLFAHFYRVWPDSLCQ